MANLVQSIYEYFFAPDTHDPLVGVSTLLSGPELKKYVTNDEINIPLTDISPVITIKPELTDDLRASLDKCVHTYLMPGLGIQAIPHDGGPKIACYRVYVQSRSFLFVGQVRPYARYTDQSMIGYIFAKRIGEPGSAITTLNFQRTAPINSKIYMNSVVNNSSAFVLTKEKYKDLHDCIKNALHFVSKNESETILATKRAVHKLDPDSEDIVMKMLGRAPRQKLNLGNLRKPFNRLANKTVGKKRGRGNNNNNRGGTKRNRPRSANS